MRTKINIEWTRTNFVSVIPYVRTKLVKPLRITAYIRNLLYEYYTSIMYIYYEGIHTYEGILNMYIYVVAR